MLIRETERDRQTETERQRERIQNIYGRHSFRPERETYHEGVQVDDFTVHNVLII